MEVAALIASKGGAVAGGLFAFLMVLVWLAVIVVVLAGEWKMFVKAGKPGWACIIPIYNIIVLLEIIGRPLWWIVLFFIPFVNIVMAVIVAIDLAKSFGKGTGFAICMIIFPYVCYPILGFGTAKYLGPAAAVGAPMGGTMGGYGTPSYGTPSYGAPTPPPAPLSVSPPPPPPAPAPMPPAAQPMAPPPAPPAAAPPMATPPAPPAAAPTPPPMQPPAPPAPPAPPTL